MNDDSEIKGNKHARALAFALLFAIRGCEIRILYESPTPSAAVLAWRDDAIAFITECLCDGRTFNATDVKALLDKSPVETRRGGY